MLDALFAPSSVAVVGASPESWYSSRLVDNLLEHGYDGDLYLVNPSRDEGWGRRCYDAVGDVPKTPELVVVCVPREAVSSVLRDAGERGVEAALVMAAGFGKPTKKGVYSKTRSRKSPTRREYRSAVPTRSAYSTPAVRSLRRRVHGLPRKAASPCSAARVRSASRRSTSAERTRTYVSHASPRRVTKPT